MTRNNVLFLNTTASYGLRGCIVLQIALDVISSLTRTRDPYVGRGLHGFVLLLILVFLLVDIFTSSGSERPHSKRIDLIAFFSWLAAFLSTIFLALMFSGDY